MKLATLNNGSRDGQLIVVNKNLTSAVLVTNIVNTLQGALDNWSDCKDKLEDVYKKLNETTVKNNSINGFEVFNLNTKDLMSPLPRAYQWADGSAYVNHVELVRKSRGVEMPKDFWTDPLMYQGGSDGFLGPCEDILVKNLEYGVDFEAEVAVITTDVPMACDLTTAKNAIALVMLVNDVSLRNLAVNEVAKGFGFFQCKPASSFSPVAVTLDELEDNWYDGKLHLPLISKLNNNLFGCPNAGTDMTFNFHQLIVHAARTRNLAAGSIIGSGTVSNVDKSVGSSCIVEKRMLELLNQGKAMTSFMQENDSIKIEMLDQNMHSIFGAIEQKVVIY